jgi:hypothetical protein
MHHSAVSSFWPRRTGFADTIVPRLLAAGADLKRVHIVTAVRAANGTRTFNLQADLDMRGRLDGSQGAGSGRRLPAPLRSAPSTDHRTILLELGLGGNLFYPETVAHVAAVAAHQTLSAEGRGLLGGTRSPEARGNCAEGRGPLQRQCISPQTASLRNKLTAASRPLRSVEAASA